MTFLFTFQKIKVLFSQFIRKTFFLFQETFFSSDPCLRVRILTKGCLPVSSSIDCELDDPARSLSDGFLFDFVFSDDFDFSSCCSCHHPVPIRCSASFSSTQPIFFAAASASSAVKPNQKNVFLRILNSRVGYV